MNYEETIDYLYNSAPMFQKVGSSAYKEGMENSFLIDKRLNHPHKKYKTIHIAGTNGKGSTSHLLASILQEAGYKTGLYTSPHLMDFRERIKVNGEMISKDFVVDFVQKNKEYFETIQPSFFELTTGMAFAYFEKEEVDVAIIEVGLGGRLDCTNVITPDLSIITNISFDHTNLLGNTLSEIAREKAGIIKKGIPVIIGETTPDTKQVFQEVFRKVNPVSETNEYTKLIDQDFNKENLHFVEDNNPILSAHLLPSGYWEFQTRDYPDLIGELGGFAQQKNAATVLSAIEELKKLGYNIPDKAVYNGFLKVIKNTGLLGRWQIVGEKPKIIFDTGHNEGGIAYIVNQLKNEDAEKLHIVFGMVDDKDISTVLKQLPTEAIYYFTKANIPRALDSEKLAEKAEKFGLKGVGYSSVSEAFVAAKEAAKEKDIIFVGGSTFVVADALNYLHDTIKNK